MGREVLLDMRVRFVQSGGFVGALRGCTLETSAMSKNDASTLEALVRSADLSASRQALSASDRDLEQYEISVDDEGRNVTVTYDQSTMPGGIKSLVAHLKKCARPGMPE